MPRSFHHPRSDQQLLDIRELDCLVFSARCRLNRANHDVISNLPPICVCQPIRMSARQDNEIAFLAMASCSSESNTRRGHIMYETRQVSRNQAAQASFFTQMKPGRQILQKFWNTRSPAWWCVVHTHERHSHRLLRCVFQ